MSDSLLHHLGIKRYYLLERRADDISTSSFITKIIWTQEYGLTRYYTEADYYYEIYLN
ncbi:MAG: hypothetical protein AB8E82_10430 [Aureispira sp.]